MVFPPYQDLGGGNAHSRCARGKCSNLPYAFQAFLVAAIFHIFHKKTSAQKRLIGAERAGCYSTTDDRSICTPPPPAPRRTAAGARLMEQRSPVFISVSKIWYLVIHILLERLIQSHRWHQQKPRQGRQQILNQTPAPKPPETRNPIP